MPLAISANISATRRGVSRRPSRSGFSPIAVRSCRTACSIDSRSCIEPLPPQSNEVVEDDMRYVGLTLERQILVKPSSTKNRDLVGFGTEAALRERDVVCDDQIQVFALQLTESVVEQI